VLIAGSGVGVVYVGGMPLLSIGAAYKAKMLCSEVFVAGPSRCAEPGVMMRSSVPSTWAAP
jgi:hypothetical protein